MKAAASKEAFAMSMNKPEIEQNQDAVATSLHEH